MDREDARRRIAALLKMTVARGCTPAEAATARRLAETLAQKHGFTIRTRESASERPDFEARYQRAEGRAAARFNWEFRTCGKKSCRCMNGGAKHGPYKYSKQRVGKTVRSIYRGR